MMFNRVKATLFSLGAGAAASFLMYMKLSQICKMLRGYGALGGELIPTITAGVVAYLFTWTVQTLIYQHQLDKIEAGRERSKILRRRYRERRHNV